MICYLELLNVKNVLLPPMVPNHLFDDKNYIAKVHRERYLKVQYIEFKSYIRKYYNGSLINMITPFFSRYETSRNFRKFT